VAVDCCVSKRPFNMVNDPHYKEEVQLLRPGTSIPCPITVSRDVNFPNGGYWTTTPTMNSPHVVPVTRNPTRWKLI
ncbi:hypothetical protein SCLCIDRAFT_123429, partial [Scleroderma citrinum Foug A]